jgi:hypothetical protein
MRYAFLAYTNEGAWATLSAAEREAEMGKFGAFVKAVEQRGIKEVNARLQPSSTATTVRGQDGQLATGSGPYAETDEQLSGIYIVNCKDLDEAVELAGMLPASRMGAVEIRAIM